MENNIQSRRIPWIALVLSFFAAGVGHVYCGRVAKGLPIYFSWLLLPICCLIAASSQPSVPGLVLLMLPAFVVLLVYVYAAIDAWQTAQQIGPGYSIKDFNRPAVYWLMIAVQLIFSLGLIAGVRSYAFEAFVIPTQSMSPTILPGDRVLANKWLGRDFFPQRGDLIVYRNPTDTAAVGFVGRVIAVAGDEVVIRGSKVFINGSELTRDRVSPENMRQFGVKMKESVAVEVNSGHRYFVAYRNRDESGEQDTSIRLTVPDRNVFVLGDNRDRSRDSRHFGSIHVGDIIGSIDYVYWPAGSWMRFGVADRVRL